MCPPSDEFDTVLHDLPVIRYYMRRYGDSCSDDDKKAVDLFRQYESHEKLNRLRAELSALKKNKVHPSIIRPVFSGRRLARFSSHTRWAEVMLILLAQKK